MRASVALLHITKTSRLIKNLKEDKREIFRAAAAAQKAADYCLAFHPDFAANEAAPGADNADETSSLAEAA